VDEVRVDSRVKHSLPVPALDLKDPFMTLRRLNVWHRHVTDRKLYENAYVMHWAVTTSLWNEHNRNILAQSISAFKRFERTVINDILLNFQPQLTYCGKASNIISEPIWTSRLRKRENYFTHYSSPKFDSLESRFTVLQLNTSLQH
jgi:hypothetical protein